MLAPNRGGDYTEIMKKAVRLAGSGLLGLSGCLAGLIAGSVALGIHLYATLYAYETAGPLAAVLTFGIPVLSAIFWAFPIAWVAGSWWNIYTAAIVLWFVCFVIMRGAFAIIGRDEQ